MTLATRPDVAARYYQLAAYTTVSGDTSTGKRLWANDGNGGRSPVSGVLVSLPPAYAAAGNAANGYIEIGGADITPGNSPVVLGPGDSVLVPAPNAAAIWIVANAAGLQVRGIVQ